MKHLIWSSVLLLGFVASPAWQAQGASLTLAAQPTVQAFDPPVPNPNSPYPPATLAFDPPVPNPNSPYPPATLAFDPPVPNPNSPYPPA